MEATTPPAGIRCPVGPGLAMARGAIAPLSVQQAKQKKTGLKREHTAAADAASQAGRLKRPCSNQQHAPCAEPGQEHHGPTPSSSEGSEDVAESPLYSTSTQQQAASSPRRGSSSRQPHEAGQGQRLALQSPIEPSEHHLVIRSQGEGPIYDAGGVLVDSGSVRDELPSAGPSDKRAHCLPQISLREDARHDDLYTPSHGHIGFGGFKLGLDSGFSHFDTARRFGDEQSRESLTLGLGQKAHALPSPSALEADGTPRAASGSPSGSYTVFSPSGFPTPLEGDSGAQTLEQPEHSVGESWVLERRRGTSRTGGSLLSPEEADGSRRSEQDLEEVSPEHTHFAHPRIPIGADRAEISNSHPESLQHASDDASGEEESNGDDSEPYVSDLDDSDVDADDGPGSEIGHGDSEDDIVQDDSEEEVIQVQDESDDLSESGRSPSQPRARDLPLEPEGNDKETDEDSQSDESDDGDIAVETDAELRSRDHLIDAAEVQHNSQAEDASDTDDEHQSDETESESAESDEDENRPPTIYGLSAEALELQQRILSRRQQIPTRPLEVPEESEDSEESAGQEVDREGFYEDSEDLDYLSEPDDYGDEDERVESMRARWRPLDNDEQPKKKRSLQSSESQEVTKTRKTVACVRCRMQKIKCDPEIEGDLEGECSACHRIAADSANTIHIGPCLRLKISDLILYRCGGLNLTRRWKGIEMRDVADRLDPTPITIRISQDLCDTPLVVRVVRFVPRDGDVTARYWTDYLEGQETFKKKELANYCLEDIVSTAEEVEQYTIDNAIPAFCHTIRRLMKDEPKYKDSSIHKTYLMALKRYMELKTADVDIRTYDAMRETKILGNLFILWAAIQHTTGSLWISGDETLGMRPETDDKTYPLHGKVSVPRMVVAQFDNLNYVWVLERYKNKLLRDVDWLLNQGNPRWWFTIYIVLFILLREASWMTKDRYRHARANYGSKVSSPSLAESRLTGEQLRYSIPSFVEDLHESCNKLLMHWHYFNSNPSPESTRPKHRRRAHLRHLEPEHRRLIATTRSDPEIVRQLSVWERAKEDNGKVEKMNYNDHSGPVPYTGGQDTYDWDHPFYWVAQLFEENWQAHPMYQREPVPKVSAAAAMAAAAG
ncbi:hypothetical protein FZEAL_5191 [Fusarium zealandicum]|uniref:Zn(2)-C6 fungal-type domain-containing protein n=1 Tax=Fusarium zealandicum TaxID=1053134 RepID=A0A8H4UK75_9HYPO|nr:hypothetical protein FZEAL_5191 [Fusarium zealandicum]